MKHETLALSNFETSVKELARSVLTDSLKSVRRRLKQATTEWTSDEEFVHQLRVSGRRAHSAIMIFEALIPDSEVRWFRKQLKAILQAAGRARDLDVLIRTQLPRCGKARKILAKQWHAERAAAQKPLVKLYRKLIQNDRFRKHMRLLLRNLRTVAADGDTEHDTQRVCDDQILPQFAERCRSVVEALGNAPDVRSLHALRIAIKKLRYAATPLLPFFKDQKVRDMIKSLEELQTQLGVMQDHVVAKQELERSIAALRKTSHQKILRELIEIEARSIVDSVATFCAWLNSDACRDLKQCIESLVIAILTDVEDNVSGSAARGVL